MSCEGILREGSVCACRPKSLKTYKLRGVEPLFGFYKGLVVVVSRECGGAYKGGVYHDRSSEIANL